VPTLVKDENSTQVIETSTMEHLVQEKVIATKNVVVARVDVLNSHIDQESCYFLHDFPNKAVRVFKSEKGDSKFSNEEY